MKIGVITADWGTYVDEVGEKHYTPGGSSWYRVHAPLNELAKRGHDVVISEQIAGGPNGLILLDMETREEEEGFDVVIFQRVMNDFVIDLIEIAQKAGQKVINDVDDWYWGLHSSNRAYSATDPQKSPTCNRDIYKKCLEMSDMVTVSTPFLRDRIIEWNPETHLIRNAIDLERWEETEIRDKPIVGWIGATGWRSDDLQTLEGYINQFVEKHDLQFHHGGYMKEYPHAAELLGIKSGRVSTVNIAPITTYPQQFKFLDISIIPLNMIDFNYAKSCIKGLESAASGTPFIAQGTPEYKWLKQEYNVGRVVRKGYQWLPHLEELLSPDVRREEAKLNRERIASLDVRERYVDWEQAYKSLL